MRERLKELAQGGPRFGYQRLHVMLSRQGWKANHKRVLRLYREEGLKLRPKKEEKKARGCFSTSAPRADSRNQPAMDDGLSEGLGA